MIIRTKKEELLEILKNWIVTNGKIPNTKDIKYRNSLSTDKTYRKYFGGLNNAIRILGYDVPPSKPIKKRKNFYEMGYRSYTKNDFSKIISDIEGAEKIADEKILHRKLKNLQIFIENENYQNSNYNQWKKVETILEKYDSTFQKI
jgi:hypothetical protein